MEVSNKVRPAGGLARLLAAAVDSVIAGCLVMIALMVGSRMSLDQIVMHATPDATRTAAEQQQAEMDLLPGGLLALAVLLVVPFANAFMLARQGTTPGKAMLGLTVRNVATGSLPGRAQALRREALRFLHVVWLHPAIPFNLGVFVVALAALDLSRHRLGQAWYDRATRTIVVAPVVDADVRGR